MMKECLPLSTIRNRARRQVQKEQRGLLSLHAWLRDLALTVGTYQAPKHIDKLPCGCERPGKSTQNPKIIRQGLRVQRDHVHSSWKCAGCGCSLHAAATPAALNDDSGVISGNGAAA